MDSLLLTPDNWDLTTSTAGDLAFIGDATAVPEDAALRLAQDVASRVRAWRGEVWFDARQGIDYVQYLGRAPAVVELQADYQAEAVRVPRCATAIASFELDRATRTLAGRLYVSDLDDYTAEVVI